MEHDKDIKDLLQGHFAKYEAEPDRDIWAGVEAGLGQKPRRVIPLWWRYGAAVAASLLLLIGVIWLLRQPNELPSGPVAEESTPAPIEAPVPENRVPDQLTQSSEEDEESPEQLIKEEEAPVIRRAVPIQKAAQPQNLAEQSPRRVVQPEGRPEQEANREMPAIGPVNPLDRTIAAAQPLTRPVNQVPEGQQVAVTRPQRIEARPINKQSVQDGQRNELNLDDLTLASAISFASDELGKWAKSPVEIYTERTPQREVRTYELDILNLRITRKVYRKSKN